MTVREGLGCTGLQRSPLSEFRIQRRRVYSRYARNRSDVGVATMFGFLGVLCLLVLVTILSYGVLLRPDLAALCNPSMAGVLQAVVGPWGAVFVSIGLLISVAGAYLSWVLLAAETTPCRAFFLTKTRAAFLRWPCSLPTPSSRSFSC